MLNCWQIQMWIRKMPNNHRQIILAVVLLVMQIRHQETTVSKQNWNLLRHVDFFPCQTGSWTRLMTAKSILNVSVTVYAWYKTSKNKLKFILETFVTSNKLLSLGKGLNFEHVNPKHILTYSTHVRCRCTSNYCPITVVPNLFNPMIP